MSAFVIVQRSARRLALLLKPLLLVPLLGGCAISTGFTGPGVVDGRVPARAEQPPMVLALTEARLKPDWSRRFAFRHHVRDIARSLQGQPGLVGYSLRTRIDGSQAWTMTVWQDEPSLKNFLRGEAHRTAVGSVSDALEGSTFARRPIKAEDLPLSWDQALQILASEGYVYQ